MPYEVKDSLLVDILQEGRAIEMYVHGQSMYPYIKDYDILSIEPVTNRVHLADIVMVKKTSDSPSCFIHRLVKIERKNDQPFFYTKGDNSIGGPEGPFIKEQIIGKVVGIKRKNLTIDLKPSPYVLFGRITVFLSVQAPRLLRITNSLFCLIFEHSLLQLNLLKRLRYRDPLFINAQRLFITIAAGIKKKYAINEAVYLIKEGVRWNYFSDLAIENGRVIATLECLHILKSYVKIPDFVFEKLNNIRLKVLAETCRYHRQLLNILKIFQDSGISVIPLKGAFLSRSLYGNIAMRGASVDIDLLIKESDKDKASYLLEGAGYQKQPEREIKVWQWYYDFSKEHHYFIDLHWDITMMLRSLQRTSLLWQDARSTRIVEDGFDIHYFAWSNEMLLLYLCTHLINSRGYRNLRYFLDIKALIENSASFDWHAFVAHAYKSGVNNSVYASLIKTKELLGLLVPQFVLDKLRPAMSKRLLIHTFLARSVIFENNIRRRILDNFLSYIFFELLEASTLEDYLKIAKRVFFPPRPVIEMGCHGYPIDSYWRYMASLLKRFVRSYHLVRKIFFDK